MPNFRDKIFKVRFTNSIQLYRRNSSGTAQLEGRNLKFSDGSAATTRMMEYALSSCTLIPCVVLLLIRRAQRTFNSISYISEGNANVVFQFGHDQILRVPKQFCSTTSPLLETRWVQELWVSLLGRRYVDVPRTITLSQSFIVKLNACLSTVEQVCERGKKRIGSRIVGGPDGRIHAQLLSNALLIARVEEQKCPFNCYSVEIKPKCGCLPSASNLPIDSPKRTTSRYHMHQHLKLHRGEIQRVSQYSPLEFFSGTEKNRKKALSDLRNDPQNNLQMFVNAKRAEPTQWMLDMVGLILSREHGLLDALLDVQKMDTIDFESPSQIVRSVKVHEILRSYSQEGKLSKVQRFLLARSAMDCSIITSFQECSGNNSSSSSSFVKESLQDVRRPGSFVFERKMYQYQITVVDLDFKSYDRMKKWKQLDQQIVAHYLLGTSFKT